MALNVDVVRSRLRDDEPEYDAMAAEWGAEALPFLAALAKSPDRTVGPRAVYLAGKIGAPGSATIVGEATSNPDPTWRLAAAGTAQNLPDVQRIEIVSMLLKDTDAGVRKFALDSTPDQVDTTLKGLLKDVATTDPVDDLRKHARDVIARLKND